MAENKRLDDLLAKVRGKLKGAPGSGQEATEELLAELVAQVKQLREEVEREKHP